MLLISWIAYIYFAKEFKASTFQHISDSLKVTAANLSNKAHLSLHTLELIRNSIPDDVMGNPVEMQHFLDNLETELLTFDNGIILFSPEGRLLAVNPKQEDVIGMDFSFRDYIKITLLNRQGYISAPIKSRQKHQHPIVMLTEPILDKEDEVLGILAGSFDLYSSHFLDPLVDKKIGQGGYYMILDQQETMLVHPEKENILKPASNFFPREQIIEFLLNSKGLIPKVNVNGVEMLGAFQHVSPLNWTLVALSPLEESYAPIKKAQIYTAIALSLFSLLIILAVRYLTTKLISPLTGLTSEVRLLAQSSDMTINLGAEQYKELGDLSESIQSLVTQLSQERKGIKGQLSFLQILIDTIPSPVFYKDSSFRYLGCNNAFEETLGISRDQLVGKSTFDISPKELAEVYHKADQDLWEHGEEQVYETSIKYADGSIRDVIFYKNIFHDAEGKPAGLIGTFLDITDRKKSETALIESEQRFRLLVENAADAFFLHDEAGNILDVNQQACESLGFSRKEFLTMTVGDLTLDHDQSSFQKIQQQLKKNQIVTIEDRHRRKDGSSVQVEVRLCHSDVNDGMTIALARDITARKREEALLQQALLDTQIAKAQVDNILSSAADGIVVTDSSNRVTHINQIAEKMLAVKAEKVTGKSFTRLFKSRELLVQVKGFIKGEIQDSQQIDFKLNLSGSQFTRIVQARTSSLRSENGESTGVVTLLHDVTRERELDQIKNEFISTAAHEMRTPMSVIMGYIEMLSNEVLFGNFSAEQQQGFLKEAYSKGEALTQIIDDLFDISRIEAGLPLPIDKEECDINEILQTVIVHFKKHTSLHDFAYDFPQDLSAVVDRNKMTQVFENLISNAIKYSPKGGLIKVHSYVDGKNMRIDIADSGMGMSKEQAERIFDKFYRADSSNTAVSGLGLGMSIVKSIVEGHGGKIWIESEQGHGTCASLSVPLS